MTTSAMCLRIYCAKRGLKTLSMVCYWDCKRSKTASSLMDLMVELNREKRVTFLFSSHDTMVIDKAGSVAKDEILRVQAPQGVAMIKGEKVVKGRPETMDDWTHYLRDASNNAAGRDKTIGTPSSMQWLASPVWSRLVR